RVDVLLAGALDLPAHRVDRAVPPLDELARQPLDAFERLPVALHVETRRPRDHRRRRAALCPEQLELALYVAATVPLQFVDKDAALLFGPRERGEVLIDGLDMADVLFLCLQGPALRREAGPPAGVVRDLVRDVVGRDANRQIRRGRSRSCGGSFLRLGALADPRPLGFRRFRLPGFGRCREQVTRFTIGRLYASGRPRLSRDLLRADLLRACEKLPGRLVAFDLCLAICPAPALSLE